MLAGPACCAPTPKIAAAIRFEASPEVRVPLLDSRYPMAPKAAPIEIGVEESEGDEPVAPIVQPKPEEVAPFSRMVEGSAVIDAGQPPEQKR